uniref:NmrA-like domain-containing protein n=1 Tax=Podospora anserina (strain S / ATCC MYA-4624 / DSM 980 / FGSC 10383) TaxID=515849 RepID=A0A090D513_PODAN|nr:Putative protein of unknown function [Podospora anserina S mat+]
MRVAIAGAGGFARILAQYISQTHSVLILSTQQPRPEVDEQCPGCQLVVVDYQDIENLRYAVLGADIIISTISGAEQLNLIDAARRARVRRFVPSEFEGDMSRRPTDDPLDRGGQSAIEMLEQLHIRYTIFSCGIFMERFAPGGLQTYHIGAGSGVQGPSDYLVDIQGCNAEIIPNNPSGRSVRVTLTSVYDVAQFVTAAIDLGISNWPREYRMRGETMTVTDLVHTCSDFHSTLLLAITVRSRHKSKNSGRTGIGATTTSTISDSCRRPLEGTTSIHPILTTMFRYNPCHLGLGWRGSGVRQPRPPAESW